MNKYKNEQKNPSKIWFFLIIIIMAGSGVWIHNAIVNKHKKKVYEIMSAIKIYDDERMFDHIQTTNAGYFLAEGNLVANDIITLPELSGGYAKIKKVKEEYKSHEEEEIVGEDENGNPIKETRTVWDWEEVDSEEFETRDYTFLGKIFTGRSIGYYPSTYKTETIYERHFWRNDIRYVYYTAPIKVRGTLKGYAENNTISGHFTETSIERMIRDAKLALKIVPYVFDFVWLVLTLVIIALIYGRPTEKLRHT
jgi:hypothetical protein